LLRIVPTACGQAAGKASYVTSSRQRVAGRVDHVIDARRLRIDRDLWVTIASRSDPSSSRCQISRVPRQAIRLAAAAHNVLCGRSFSWWSQTESNRRPPACKAGALPTELWPLQMSGIRSQYSGACTPMPIPDPEKVVGLGRFELPTSRLSSARSNQLSYKPLGQETVISRRKSAPRRIAASCRSLTSDP
jgi:hypothetical protein